MHPILIDFGRHELPLLGEVHVALPTYGVLFALAVVTAWLWFSSRGTRMGASPAALFDLMFYTLLAGIGGAKLLLILVDWKSYLNDPAQLFSTLRSGGVLLGGVLFGAATFLLYARHRGLEMWRLLDGMAAPLILAQAIGRFGCFGGGCCWGAQVAHDHPLAVTYTSTVAHEQTSIPLHTPLLPIQLIEAFVDLLLAGVLTLLWRRQPKPAGTVWWSYVLLYGTARIVLEQFRGDEHRGIWLGETLSTSQLLSGIAVLASIVILIRGRILSKRSPA